MDAGYECSKVRGNRRLPVLATMVAAPTAVKTFYVKVHRIDVGEHKCQS
jgi:hypothetical protein